MKEPSFIIMPTLMQLGRPDLVVATRKCDRCGALCFIAQSSLDLEKREDIAGRMCWDCHLKHEEQHGPAKKIGVAERLEELDKEGL